MKPYMIEHEGELYIRFRELQDRERAWEKLKSELYARIFKQQAELALTQTPPTTTTRVELVEPEPEEQEDGSLTVYTCPVCEQHGCVFGVPGLLPVEIIRQCPYRMTIRPLEHRSALERWEVLIKTSPTGGKTP